MTRAHEVGADIVVVTAVGLEYDAVRGHLTGTHRHIDSDGTRYEIGALHGGPCRVALAVMGEGNLAAAALTGRAIEEFDPRAVMLVGVAGGLRDKVAIGDVVVATRIHAYQGGREDSGGFHPHPKGWPLAHRLEQTAREVAHIGAWTRLLTGVTDGITIHFKPVVCGEVVLDSSTSHSATVIAKHYSDAVAVEMESAGVAEAAHRKDFRNAITIRGISDGADGHKRQADAAGGQPMAAARAAAFAMALAERIVVGAAPDAARVLGPCPYRGLAAFTEQDATLFFGRDEMADELAGLVSRTRFVAVAGRSGSGKSSLVHAGLVPRLRGRGWAVAAFRPLPDVPAATALAGGLLPLLRPGLDPVTALAQRTIVAAAITSGRLPELAGDVLTATGAPGLLVCVDQFEELVARAEPAARDLAAQLVQLSTCAARAHVVVTMRTETLDVAVNRLGLGELTRNSVFLLTPMRAGQLRAAIEAPAAPAGARFEPGLVPRILESAQDAPAALTLVQFALTRLWDAQDHGLLTHAAYDAFGGVAGALAGYAEQVWATELDDTDRARARRLLVQLVRPDGDDVVRRTARAAELEPDLVRVARRLATTRLVVTGTDPTGQPSYDLAHAALATHWQRLRDWLADERDFRAWQEDLRDSIRRDEPLRGPRLAHAVRWLREHPDGISATERDFITTSRRRQRRRTAAWRGGVALIVALLVVATTFAINLRTRTGELEDQLRRNAAQALLTQARDRVNSQPDTAALMAVAAYRADPDPAVLVNLAGEYLRYRSTTRLLNPGIGQIQQVQVSVDGRVVAALGTIGVGIWRMDQMPPAFEHLDWRPRTITLNHNGTLLAGSADGGRVELRLPDGSVVPLHQGQSRHPAATILQFDPTGQRLLAVLPEEGLLIWDVNRRNAVTVPTDAVRKAGRNPATADYPNTVSFGPDPDTIIVAGDGALTRWHVATRAATNLIQLDKAEAHTSVSRDGRTAMACVGKAIVRWDLTTLRERDRRPFDQLNCPLEFRTSTESVIRDRLYQPEGGNTHPRQQLSLIDLDAGTAARAVIPATDPHDNLDESIAASASGVRLATAVGTAVAVIDVDPARFQPINQMLTPGMGSSPVFSPDHRLAATVSHQPQHLIQLWDTATGQEVARATDSSASLPARFSADGSRLLILDRERKNLLAVEVPSLRAIGKLPMPAVQGSDRPPVFRYCIADTSAPDTVAVMHAGAIRRFNLRSATPVGQSLHPWRQPQDLARLAGTEPCSIRPGHNHMAFNVERDIEIWDLERDDHVATLPIQSTSQIGDLAFSPDGQLLAVLGRDGMLYVWDVERRQPIDIPIRVQEASLLSTIVDFPDRDRIIVRNSDELRVWDLNRDTATATVDILSFTYTRHVAADADNLLMWSDSGLVTMPLNPQQWADHLCRIIGRDLTDTERRILPPGAPTENICPQG